VDVVYMRSWVEDAVKWLILILVIGILYLNRRILARIVRWGRDRSCDIGEWFQRHEKQAKSAVRSRVAPIVLLCLMVVFWSVSTSLTILIFILFSISLAYQIARHRERRAKIEAESRGDEHDTVSP
jgi:hypothetical protein